MTSKVELIETILNELRRAQTSKWKRPASGTTYRLVLPPSLPLRDGRNLGATEALLQAVSSFAEIWLENDSSLPPRFTVKEFTQLASQAFGQCLDVIDLERENYELVSIISEGVSSLLKDWMDQRNQASDLTLGCYFLRGEDPYPMNVGPVIFETRAQWCQRLLNLRRLTPVTVRRLQAYWNGKSIKKRKPSFDADTEEALLDAIGTCPVVCTVETSGLSGKYMQEKGILAARLAMTAIALIWNRPSETLPWMHLLYDRRVPHRYTATFHENGQVGRSSETTQLLGGRWTDAELIATLSSRQQIFAKLGQALCTYVQPNQTTNKPTIMNALFLSLWWFHEACREPHDQIATTKFAASMDALVVGQNSDAIIRFIGARLGSQADDRIMKDGRTTKEAIQKIYSASRSRLIHGNSTDYAHDWSQVRGMAEAIGRSCLIEASDWLSHNPDENDLAALSRP